MNGELEKNLIDIKSTFTKWDSSLKLDNSEGLFNINKLSENFCRDIFNIIFEQENVELENVNLFRSNFPAIDLADKNGKYAIQVTSNSTYKKVKDTLNKFIENKYYKNYNTLLIIILGFEKPKLNRLGKVVKTKFNKDNILCFEDIYKLINNLPHQKIAKIKEYMLNEEDNLNVNKKIEEEKKKLSKNILIDFPVIERLLTYVKKENEHSFNYTIKDIANKKTNEITVITGDAATGKTIVLKSIANIINKNSNLLAIYKELKYYSNESIYDYITRKYNYIDKKRLVFVLDGVDEIEEKYLNDFLKRIEEYNKNEDVRIILSCRSNIYSNIKNQFNFYEISLRRFSESDIREFFANKEINYNDLKTELEKENYGFLLYSPFYLNIICDFYKKNKILPDKNMILEYAILNIYEEDNEKYKKNDEYIKKISKKQKSIVQKLGFSLECLGKNNISDSDLKLLFGNDYEYLKYCGLLTKNKENWSFIHNNFGEYLASKELEKYTFKELKKIIFLKNSNKIKPTWYNTIAFYLSSNNCNKKLENIIIKHNFDLIFYIEKDRVDNSKKLTIFNKIIKYYMNNNIWLPTELYFNSRLAEFFAIEEIVNKLCNIVIENKHHVTTHNAIRLLLQMVVFIKNDNIVTIFKNILTSKEYNKYDKKDALYLLANMDYGNEKFIKNLIDDIKNEENQYLRTGYFYYINKMNLVDSMIDEILNYFEIIEHGFVARKIDDDYDDEDINLMDEYIEYYSLFNNIQSEESINKVIDYFKNYKNNYEFIMENIVENLIISIENLNAVKSFQNYLIIKLCLIFLKKYDINILKILLEIIDKRKLRLELFKSVLKISNKLFIYDLYFIINDECINYFIEEYEKNNYTDDVALYILRQISSQSNEYIQLREIYEHKTGIKVEEPHHPMSKAEKANLLQEYFNNLFDKRKYINTIDKFFELCKKDIFNSTELYNIENENKLWDNIVFQNFKKFLHRNYKEKSIAKNKIIESLEKIDWDTEFIIQIYDILQMDNQIKIHQKQLNIIKVYCLSTLNKIDFKINIINKIIKLRYMLKLKFPKDKLLYILSLNQIKVSDKLEIQSIIDSVGLNSCKKILIDNFNSKKSSYSLLEFYLDFFVENNIDVDENIVYEYYCSNKSLYVVKVKSLNYILIKDNKKLINKIVKGFNNIDDMTLNYVISYFDKNHKLVLKYLLSMYDEINEINLKMLINKIAMNNNISIGFKEYYKYLNKENKCYSEELNSSICNANDILKLNILYKMLQLTFNKDFIENKFCSLYSCVIKAIENIGRKNSFNKKFVILLTNIFILKNRKEKEIGFLNYIKIHLDACKLNQKNITLEEVKKILKK